jgi:hypothetical protein
MSLLVLDMAFSLVRTSCWGWRRSGTGWITSPCSTIAVLQREDVDDCVAWRLVVVKIEGKTLVMIEASLAPDHEWADDFSE